MAKLQYRSISRRTVETLRAEKDTVYWDNELTGFGIRVYPSGTKVYMVQSRGPGGLKRVTVGRHGVISADRARRRAGLIIARIKAGEAPLATPMAREATGPTVADLAERYFREHVVVRCKPGTAKLHRRVVRKHILPGFGKLPVAAIGREHVTDLHYRLRHVPAMANQVIVTLSRILNQAEIWGLVPEGGNPCRFVVKYRQRKRERFLTEEEFRRLGRVLGALEACGTGAGACGGGDPLADADRVPAQRDSDLAMGGCAPGRERAPASRQQDGAAGGSIVAGGGEGSHRFTAGRRQSLGHCGPQTGRAPVGLQQPLVSRKVTRRA